MNWMGKLLSLIFVGAGVAACTLTASANLCPTACGTNASCQTSNGISACACDPGFVYDSYGVCVPGGGGGPTACTDYTRGGYQSGSTMPSTASVAIQSGFVVSGSSWYGSATFTTVSDYQSYGVGGACCGAEEEGVAYCAAGGSGTTIVVCSGGAWRWYSCASAVNAGICGEDGCGRIDCFDSTRPPPDPSCR